MKHCSSGREELHTLGTSGTPHPLGQVMQGELTLATGKGLPQSSRSLQKARGVRRVGRFLLAAEGPSCLLGTPGPALGTSGRGLHRNVGALCSGGDSRDVAAAPSISHTWSLASSEDARGWWTARVAVPSGSSFPRNPLGATLGIPGNTVLGATARRLEAAHPAGSHSLWKSR